MYATQKRFEHARIAEYFEARGCPTIVCDPRSLRRPGRRLEHEGRPIDLVYRRALFTELLDHKTEVEPLISAYRDGAVCMVNPLRSYLESLQRVAGILAQKQAQLWINHDQAQSVAQKHAPAYYE